MKPAHLLVGFVLLVASTIAVPALSEEIAQAGQAPSCGEWIVHREKSSTLALSDTGWLRGYLSGMASSSGKNFLSNIDNASIYRWMDNYCRNNPLRDVGGGAKALALELAGKQAAPK